MPEMNTPFGRLPEGLPDDAPPADAVFVHTNEGRAVVYAVRPTIDTANLGVADEDRELEVLASFSMSVEQFLNSFGLVVEGIRRDASPGRNQPCPCGSGKKFKHCHGAA